MFYEKLIRSYTTDVIGGHSHFNPPPPAVHISFDTHTTMYSSNYYYYQRGISLF